MARFALYPLSLSPTLDEPASVSAAQAITPVMFPPRHHGVVREGVTAGPTILPVECTMTVEIDGPSSEAVVEPGSITAPILRRDLE